MHMCLPIQAGPGRTFCFPPEAPFPEPCRIQLLIFFLCLSIECFTLVLCHPGARLLATRILCGGAPYNTR